MQHALANYRDCRAIHFLPKSAKHAPLHTHTIHAYTPAYTYKNTHTHTHTFHASPTYRSPLGHGARRHLAAGETARLLQLLPHSGILVANACGTAKTAPPAPVSTAVHEFRAVNDPA